MKHQNRKRRGKTGGFVAVAAVVIAAAVIAVGVVLHSRSKNSAGPLPVKLPASTGSYLGVYTHGTPASYTGVERFKNATGSNPDVVMYYSGWFVKFPTRFATTVADEGAVPLVQMDPYKVSVASVASGRWDGYLSAFAESVRAYGHPVILSFGHEMNGDWYPWGHGQTSPQTFIRAWRHIVTLFRYLQVKNVTWLWTVNIINNTRGGNIPNPAQWWPGGQYVNWVGIDGYYLKPSWQFAPLFGPTITAVRKLTLDPILIAETGAVPAAGQPAKIADLFAGIRHYGLLGFVWFDATSYAHQKFGISSAAALAAFHKGASTYNRPGS
jgi:mannan endo-1,4-beta-mannosidase